MNGWQSLRFAFSSGHFDFTWSDHCQRKQLRTLFKGHILWGSSCLEDFVIYFTVRIKKITWLQWITTGRWTGIHWGCKAVPFCSDLAASLSTLVCPLEDVLSLHSRVWFHVGSADCVLVYKVSDGLDGPETDGSALSWRSETLDFCFNHSKQERILIWNRNKNKLK